MPRWLQSLLHWLWFSRHVCSGQPQVSRWSAKLLPICADDARLCILETTHWRGIVIGVAGRTSVSSRTHKRRVDIFCGGVCMCIIIMMYI